MVLNMSGKIFQNEWKKFPKKILNIYYGKILKKNTTDFVEYHENKKSGADFLRPLPPDGLTITTNSYSRPLQPSSACRCG